MVFFRDEDGEGSGDSPEVKASGGSGGGIPLLPLRDIVVFPHMVAPLFVGREKSIQALEDAMAGSRELMLSAQREAGEEEPSADDIYDIGTLGTIIQLLRLPDGTVKVLVEGRKRVRIAHGWGPESLLFRLASTERARAHARALRLLSHPGRFGGRL